MSAIAPPSISDRILDPLNAVSQRQWTVLAARGVLKTLVISLSVLLAASLLLGFLPGIPMVIRIVLALATWTAILWATVRSLRPALHRWSLSLAAQRADGSMPDSQERISSAVELSQADEQFRGSPVLVAHLVEQAEDDAQRISAASVVPFQSVFHWMWAVLPVLALWAFFAINPHTARILMRGLFATLTPWENPPAALADVAVKPGDKTLDQGDPLKISVTVSTAGKPAKNASIVQAFGTGQSVSKNLEQTGGTQFGLDLDNLQQGFKYKISTDRGDSPWYTITVRPRPAITRLDAQYDFPKYTGLESKTFTASDGNIDAVVGTHVTLTLHTSEALVTDKSELVFDDGKLTHASIPLTPGADKNEYMARFDVTHTGDYRINLLNELNLGNKDNDPRAVTAEPDQPPTIEILSPKDQITVRDDDDVTVMYAAADDYAVARVEALVQVDDRPERAMPVLIRGKNRRNIKEGWTLSIPEVLRQEGVPEATRISYQLKATDNRDPDPQTATSVRNTLLISKNEPKSFQDKLNEIRKEDLIAAIHKAIERLNQDAGKVAATAR